VSLMLWSAVRRAIIRHRESELDVLLTPPHSVLMQVLTCVLAPRHSDVVLIVLEDLDCVSKLNRPRNVQVMLFVHRLEPVGANCQNNRFRRCHACWQERAF